MFTNEGPRVSVPYVQRIAPAGLFPLLTYIIYLNLNSLVE